MSVWERSGAGRGGRVLEAEVANRWAGVRGTKEGRVREGCDTARLQVADGASCGAGQQVGWCEGEKGV